MHTRATSPTTSSIPLPPAPPLDAHATSSTDQLQVASHGAMPLSHSSGASSTVETMLRRHQMNDIADFSAVVKHIHSMMEGFGMVNPYAWHSTNLPLPKLFTKGPLYAVPEYDALRYVDTCEPLRQPTTKSESAWKRQKEKMGKEMAAFEREVDDIDRTFLDDQVTFPKRCSDLTSFYNTLGKPRSDLIQVLSSQKTRALDRVSDKLDRLVEIAQSLPNFHDGERRKNLQQSLRTALTTGIHSRFLIADCAPHTVDVYCDSLWKQSAEFESAFILSDDALDENAANDIASRIKETTQEMLPEVLAEAWVSVKSIFDSMLLVDYCHKTMYIGEGLVSESGRQMLLDAIKLIRCIHRGPQYAQYVPDAESKLNIPDISLRAEKLAQVAIDKTKHLRLTTEETESADKFSPAHFMEGFVDAHQTWNIAANTLLAICTKHAAGGMTPQTTSEAVEVMGGIAITLGDVADAFETLAEVLHTEMEAGITDDIGNVMPKAEMTLHELKFLEFLAHVTSCVAKAYMDILANESISDALDSDDKEVVHTPTVQRSPSPMPVRDADAPISQPPVATLNQTNSPVSKKPQKLGAPTHPAIEIISQIARLQNDAKKLMSDAKQEFNKHREALTNLSSNSALAEAIRLSHEAAQKLEAAIATMDKDGRDNLASIDRTKLEQGLTSCQDLAALYRAYQESPWSQPPTEDLLRHLDQQPGSYEPRRPADRAAFQRFGEQQEQGGYTDNMFEVVINFPPFIHGQNAIEIRPVYLHIHVKPGVTEDRLDNLNAEDIITAHLKSARQRLRGKSYTERTNRSVARSIVIADYAAGLARRAAGSVAE